MLDEKQEKKKQPAFSKKIKKKQFVALVVVVAMVCLAIGVLPSHKPTPKKMPQKIEVVSIDPAVKKDEENVAVVKKVEKSFGDLQYENKQLHVKEDAKLESLQKTVLALKESLKKQAVQLAEISAQKLRKIPQNKKTSKRDESEQMKVWKANLLAKKEKKKNIRTTKNYVLGGTIARAVVLGGADVGAGVRSQANPNTMLLRILNDGDMPGPAKSHLKNCVVIASVSGDISSERGFVRAESINCSWPNGRIFEKNIKAVVFGIDGKEGIRGRAVFREGSILKHAFLAGAIGSMSKAAAQTMTTPISLADGFRKTVLPKDVLSFGAAQGTGDAMSQLAQYHIKRAEMYHPIIQLKSGQLVAIIFKRGFSFEEVDDVGRNALANSFKIGGEATNDV